MTAKGHKLKKDEIEYEDDNEDKKELELYADHKDPYDTHHGKIPEEYNLNLPWRPPTRGLVKDHYLDVKQPGIEGRDQYDDFGYEDYHQNSYRKKPEIPAYDHRPSYKGHDEKRDYERHFGLHKDNYHKDYEHDDYKKKESHAHDNYADWGKQSLHKEDYGLYDEHKEPSYGHQDSYGHNDYEIEKIHYDLN